MADFPGTIAAIEPESGIHRPSFKAVLPPRPAATFALVEGDGGESPVSNSGNPVMFHADLALRIGHRVSPSLDLALLIGTQTQIVVDLTAKVIRLSAVSVPMRIAITGHQSLLLPLALAIGHKPVSTLMDTLLKVRRVQLVTLPMRLSLGNRIDAMPDSRLLISGNTKSTLDALLRIGHFKTSKGDVAQTIYHVLLHEDHLIQT